MSILEKLQIDLKEAMKSGEKVRVDAIRMLITRLRNERIAKGEDLPEGEELSALSKEAKKRKESIEIYKKGSRFELAEKEAKELEIISSYLPKEFSDEELIQIIDRAVDESGADSLKDMGKVMGIVMPQVKDRADGKRIQELVRQKLS
ncbi:GatB/YqeY domain-containing protein [bacterium]|nr:GatB/YqeY domain-containing protein [bacterium]